VFTSAVANLSLDSNFLGAKEFAAFWEADAKRSDEAVLLIGKQG
jgi:hypothetical protein